MPLVVLPVTAILIVPELTNTLLEFYNAGDTFVVGAAKVELYFIVSVHVLVNEPPHKNLPFKCPELSKIAAAPPPATA